MEYVPLKWDEVEGEISGPLTAATQNDMASPVTDAIVERLDSKLHQWKPEVSGEVRALLAEIIELADADSLDLMRSRAVEQEVLDML
jgi:hypothetical protein